MCCWWCWSQQWMAFQVTSGGMGEAEEGRGPGLGRATGRVKVNRWTIGGQT